MQKAIHILMIDDDEEDFMITRDIISRIRTTIFKIELASSSEEGLRQIAGKRHDVYLVDYRLGAGNGLDLIRKAIASGCDAPLILLTGQNDSEIDARALKAGAADYLVKGTFNGLQLERSIRYSFEHAKSLREIKTLNAELEKRVKDRTMILEEALRELGGSREELRIALDREKELNELKSRFVTMASHEFRTPLATILSSLSLVSKYGEQQEKEKQAKHMDRIKSSVMHLTDILNDVLSLSKLEEGKVHLSLEKFDVNVLGSNLVQEMESIAKPGQTIIHKHSGANEIVLDKKVLKHILFNLISNAIKFSPEGRPIEVSLEVNRACLILSVKDHGLGISEEDQKHLFERFFRGQNVTNIQGTGLGLNIVSKYVEILNGRIGVQSRLEEGTIFRVEFPCEEKVKQVSID
jgi:signal transduction histidine kinase